MTKFDLKYTDKVKNRHGQTFYYFRRGKGERIRLSGLPGSNEFMVAYAKALEKNGVSAPEIKLRGAPGTFDRLLGLYFASPNFLDLSPSTQKAYRAVIERFIKEEGWGHRPVNGLKAEHVLKMLGKRAETPGAGNDVLKKLRILVNFAILLEWRATDPTRKIKKYKAGKFHRWIPAECKQFEERWALGTKQRVAYDLFFYTAQRLSDVARMGPGHIETRVFDGVPVKGLRVVQDKTGTELWIPLHPNLEASLAAAPKGHLCYLVTEFGRPFSPKGLSNFMASAIEAAGLPERCVTHGIRKGSLSSYAEHGNTTKELQAIGGHKSIKELEGYVEEVERQHLAVSGIRKLPARKGT